MEEATISQGVWGEHKPVLQELSFAQDMWILSSFLYEKKIYESM
jgi:hypothetical protein